MRRIASCALLALLLGTLAPRDVVAAVNVQRRGHENPMKEVATSVIYGGLAGLVVGGAIAWATEDNGNDGEIVRWSTVTGTFAGLAIGVWWITARPQPAAALEFGDGPPRFSIPEVTLDRDGAARVRLAAVRF